MLKNMNKRLSDATKYSLSSNGIGISLAVIFIWILTLAGLKVPLEVATAITGIFTFVTNIALVRWGIISNQEE